MNIITLDFETFFSADYTLSNLTTEEYVRDSRFEVHGVGIDWQQYPDAGAAKIIWYDAPTAEHVLPQVDWSTTAVLCHHTHFDGLILSHVYGIKPAMYLDTLSMARLLFGNHIKKSLGALAEMFGLGAKDVPYDLFKGKHWHELSPSAQRQVAYGCCQDVKLTWDLFCKLAQSLPASEYAFVDATVRMFTQPVLEGDTDLLAQIWEKEAATKAALLEKLGVSATDLRKQWKFAEILRSEDIEPEQKPGKPQACKTCEDNDQGRIYDGSLCPDCGGTKQIERWNYSFAKTDDFMRELLEDETPLATMPEATVSMLAQAKLDAHSNGTQTRVERMGHMSTRGALCVYLNYAGTHLSGWSGGDKMNWQNFRRGGPIAEAIRAPKGHKVVVADASQIECRLLNKVAGQSDVVERFRKHEDPYVSLASVFYGRTITKADQAERGTGKQGELSCGYGAGAKTIQATAKRGTYGPPVHMTDEEALRLRDTYRETHPYVQALWNEGTDVLKKLAAGMEFDWNVVHIKDKMMWLPNGVPLRYDTIEWHDNGEKQGWRIKSRNGWSWMYGSKFIENLIQALRNVFIRQAWQDCIDAGLPVVSMEHDKLICLAREHEADDALKFLQAAMSRPPAWLPDIPLDSEGYISGTFAKEKQDVR
jgi:DNA polymerase family A